MALTVETFPPAPGGVNVAIAAQELDDTEAHMIQDALVNRPGELPRRGPVTPVSGLAQPTRMGTGLVTTIDPLGSDRYAVLNGDGSNGYLSVWSSDLSALVDLAWPHALPTDPASGASTAYRIVDAKPSLTGGALIGVSSRYDANSPNQGIAFWRGGNKANYANTITATRGSAVVTGTGFNANVVPGMFLFADSSTDHGAGYSNVYIGIVLQINSDTNLTLGSVSPYTAAGRAGTFQSLRGIAPRVAKGLITAATNSTTVSGGETKFKAQGLGTGTWDIFRRNDWAWIGKVASVADNDTLTLAANAAVDVSDEEYIALRADADFSIINTANVNKVGFINAVYAEHQWYFNLGAQFEKTHRGWFSDTNDPEALDLSEDGDWLEFGSTTIANEPIRAAMPAHNALLVFKENETFGVFGTSPSNFTPKKVEDDGALSGMSVQPWGGGVVWAGREGIHFYDGIQVENITAKKLGKVWKDSVESFDPSRYRMWSTIIHDHYYLFIEDLDPTVAIVKGNTSTTPTTWGVAINMLTRSPVFFTNVEMRGAITLPASTGLDVWYLVNGQLSSAVQTAGKSAVGASSTSFAGDVKVANQTTLAVASQVTKLTAYLDGLGSGTGNQKLKGALYADSAGSPGAWIATTNEVTVTDGQAAGWVDLTFASAVSLAAGTYWLVLHADITNTNTIRYYYDAGSPSVFNADTYSDGPANPFGATTALSQLISLYATFTETVHGFVCDGSALFNSEGVDTVQSLGAIKGPDWYIETKKFAAGDDLRLKRFKQFAVHYLAQGGSIKIDVVLGLNNVGRTLLSSFPPSVYTWDTLKNALANWDAVKLEFPTWNDLIQGVFVPKRVKYMKKTQHVSFRLYQSNSTMARVKIGPYQIGYKLQRPGRVN